MMDPSQMFPQGFHPIATVLRKQGDVKAPFHFSRTERPPKYYLIDFGISRKFSVNETTPTVMPHVGADPTAPEFRGEGESIPQNPFPTDIYYIGNLVKTHFIEVNDSFFKLSVPVPNTQTQEYTNFDFMSDLVNDMIQEDPGKRPTIDEAMARLNSIISSLGFFKPRSRLHPAGMPSIFFFLFKQIPHVFREMNYTIRGLCPVPYPGK